ncbi:MAG: undecaprenyl-diphosphate phosphatase [Candidatus Omnitrophica bacterium]|nr:undecaprenyl-diphosphate phosphatase [Candidatus Omnitrophota bacterium]
MTIIKYIFLGVIQGLTEFLPVSSSAHLVLFQNLLEVRENQLLLDIVLHLGTLASLVVFLFKDIKALLEKRILLYIFLVTVLTAAVAIIGKDFFEGMFYSAKTVTLPLFITGLVLLCTKRFTQGRRNLSGLRIMDALWLGIVQGISVIPGLSRSGLTISTLLFRKVERETAFKFSFLASVPAIIGALFFKIEGFCGLSFFEFKYMMFGFLASFLSGLLALRILFAVIRQARLHIFGYYCLALGLILLWIY